MTSSTTTAPDLRTSLTDHAALKGAEVRAKYGAGLGWAELLRLLADRECVRYPCEIAFDASPLQPGEFAHAVPNGEMPEAGFTLYVHPVYSLDLPSVPALVLYQLVAVNYGPFASAGDAEAFGAAAMGLSRDAYYQHVCTLAERVNGGAEGALDGNNEPDDDRCP